MPDHGRTPRPDESVILDIGGDDGALILYTDPADVGREIEVSPLDAPDARVHTAIHQRKVGDRVVHAGVFPRLAAGTYRIWTDRPGSIDRVTIAAGAVAEVDWTRPQPGRLEHDPGDLAPPGRRNVRGNPDGGARRSAPVQHGEARSAHDGTS